MPQQTDQAGIEGLPITKNGALKVELVPMPGADNPWRTREDYRKDQDRDAIRFRITVLTLIVSMIATAATAAIAIVTITSMS